MKAVVRSFLVEWTVDFVKNKDVIAKKIEKIEDGKDGFDLHVKYKDKEQYFVVMPALHDFESVLHKMDNWHNLAIVTLNSKENLDVVLKNWDKLVGFKFLSIIFVNPFSEMDKKWIILPYVHNKISDDKSLQAGLKSMFSMVEPIEEGQLIAKIG